MTASEQHQVQLVESIDSFQEEVDFASKMVEDEVSSYLMRTLKTVEGNTLFSIGNANTLSMLPTIFSQAIDSSNYSALLVDFSTSLYNQAINFRNIYDEDVARIPELPPFFLSDDDAELLQTQAAATLQALDAHVTYTKSSLIKQSSKSIGEHPVDDIVRGISAVVRRISEVKSIAVNQSMIFFRLTGNLVYDHAEHQGQRLLYSYHGPTPKSDWCSDALPSLTSMRHLDVRSHVNSEGLSTAVVGGHYGCKHWFRVSGRI